MLRYLNFFLVALLLIDHLVDSVSGDYKGQDNSEDLFSHDLEGDLCDREPQLSDDEWEQCMESKSSRFKTLMGGQHHISRNDVDRTVLLLNNTLKKIKEKDKMINKQTFKNFCDVSDLVISHEDNEADDVPISTRNERIESTQMMALASCLQHLATHVSLSDGEKVSIDTTQTSIQIYDLSSDTGGIECSNYDTSGKDVGPRQVSRQQQSTTSTKVHMRAEIPAEALIKARNQTGKQHLNAVFMFFRNARDFEKDEWTPKHVLSINVGDTSLRNLSTPVWFQISSGQRDKQKLRCGYYNESEERWKLDGCQSVPGLGLLNCTCNHMTNFAVLVRSTALKSNFTLSVFTKIACSLSAIGLILMMVIHVSCKKLREQATTRMHLNLCFSMALAYVTFLLGVERPRPYTPCVMAAGIIHFSLLSAWGWMTVECYTMYRKFIQIFRPLGDYFVTKAAIAVYTCSGIIVTITLGISIGFDNTNHQENGGYSMGGPLSQDGVRYTSSYLSDQLCWLKAYPYYFSFLFPVGIMFVANFCGFFFIIRAITWKREQIPSNMKIATLKDNVIRCVFVSTLLGTAWIFAIPLSISEDEVVQEIFSWLFTCTNTLQGFFIFILFCLRRSDVRDIWLGPIWRVLSTWRNMREDVVADERKEHFNSIDHRVASSPNTIAAIKQQETQVEEINSDVHMDIWIVV